MQKVVQRLTGICISALSPIAHRAFRAAEPIRPDATGHHMPGRPADATAPLITARTVFQQLPSLVAPSDIDAASPTQSSPPLILPVPCVYIPPDVPESPPRPKPRQRRKIHKSISMDPGHCRAPEFPAAAPPPSPPPEAAAPPDRPKSLFLRGAPAARSAAVTIGPVETPTPEAEPAAAAEEDPDDADRLGEKYKRKRSLSWLGINFKRKGSGGAGRARHTLHEAVAVDEDGATYDIVPSGGDAEPGSGFRFVKRGSVSKRGERADRPPRFGARCSLVDLRGDGEESGGPLSPVVNAVRRLHIMPKEKIESSFSRSRSSSMSSLENITSEAIQCLAFADSYTRKSDCVTCPTLWVGTSLGSVLVIILNLPPTPDLRQTQPVIVSPSGTIFRLKGAILALAFLDCNGALIHYQFENWRDINKLDVKEKERERPKTPLRSPHNPTSRVSPTTSSELGDRQFSVLVSEKQVCVVALPSQTCAFKAQITECSFVVKADIISVRDSVCLACYIANGHLATFSLPSLRPLMDIEFLPLIDLRIARTFCFSNYGHGMYLCSPCEIQKFTICVGFCDNLNEMLGDLFLPCETPEAPKESFFRNLFGGGARLLDREELFGEASGKASRSVAKHIPGNINVEHLNAKAGGVAGDVARAHKALTERGENLGTLEDRTVRMMSEAETFSQAAHHIMLKQKDKKWYQF